MTTRKSATNPKLTKGKKVVLARKTRGKTSVEKGRKFEDAVADLYRLLGAHVIQNIEIHQKKVDILATFKVPGSTREHRVIVECKDEKKAINANQRVQAFKGLLDVARVAGTADSAEIITRVPWSDQAKGFAKASGVELFTYSEKIAQLIDLTRYLKNLISKFEKGDSGRPSDPPLGAYYVDLSAEKVVDRKASKIPVIDKLIHDWLNDSSVRFHLAIFGEYGSGKSSLCHKLSHDLAKSYLNNSSSSRIPILLNLREFIGKLDLEAYITSFLDRECKVTNPRIELFKAMNDAGIFLLIFDGFDEMAVKVDADTLESNLLEIEKLTGSNNARLLLTSRPEYFISTEEEKEALNPVVNPFLNRATSYQPMKILPWDEKQVALFLRRRVPLVKGATQPWTYYRDKIRTIGSLADLSQRPVLLDMIVKTLPTLIASGAPINLPNLYRTYLIGEMKRQKVLKKRTLLLSDNDRLRLLQQLAIDIYSQKTPVLGFSDAQIYIERNIKPPKHELEAHTRDFLTNSFLIRRGDGYYFSHKSILEYLVAAQLNTEIQSSKPDAFGKSEIDGVILKFLKELEPDPVTLISWIESTKEKPGGSVLPILGGNAATLLCALSPDYLAGKDLSGSDLTKANLMDANLRGTSLRGTMLRNARMYSAMFLKAEFAEAVLGDTMISFYCPRAGLLGQFESFMEMHESIEKAIDGRDGAARGKFVGIRATSREELVVEPVVFIDNHADIESTRTHLSSVFTTKVAVYADEIDELYRESGLT